MAAIVEAEERRAAEVLERDRAGLLRPVDEILEGREIPGDRAEEILGPDGVSGSSRVPIAWR